MRRLRLNVPLVLGALLALALLIAIILPAVVDLGDYQTVRVGFNTSGSDVSYVKAPIPPGEGLPLGSDGAGRNLLPRVLLGLRLTLLMGMIILTLRSVIAVPLGLFAGWRGGRWGKTMKSFTFGANALPAVVLTSLALRMIFRFNIVEAQAPRYMMFMAVLTLLGVPRLAEQVRSLVANVRNRPHVEAAISLGATDWRLVRRHVWPIIRGDLVVSLAAEMAWVLIAIGQLAVVDVYVGEMITVQPTPLTQFLIEQTPELGVMLSINKDALRYQWWPAVYPAMALGLIIACFQLLADGLRIRWQRRG